VTDQLTTEELADNTREAEYFALVDQLRADARARFIAVTNRGGDITDSVGLVRLWDTLRPDLDELSHRRVTRVWLATCGLDGQEADDIRSFIAFACREMDWTKGKGGKA
jgi:hypothetical protein